MPSSSVNNADHQPAVQLEVSLVPRTVNIDSNGTLNIVIQVGNIYQRTITPQLPVRYHLEREPAGFRLVRENPTPAAAERFRIEKLEENEEQQDLKSCSICLDEIDCKKCECVRIVCGHVYHKSCILNWLNNSNSCPICRTPLPLTG